MKIKETEKQTRGKRNKRIAFAGAFLTFCFVVIAVKAVHLQVFAGEALSARAASEYKRDYKSTGRRGNIYDVTSRELVVTANAVSVGARPARMASPMKAAAIISEILDIDKHTVEKTLASERPFVWIERNASPNQAAALSEAVPEGLDFIKNHSRIYPNRQLAAQVLGFAGVDGNGLEGLEFYYDDYLMGKTYGQTVVKDALGRIFQREEISTPDMEGKHLVLTIDANIQSISEQALTRAARLHNARSGIAVVMVPGNR
jgi:cell division protein FtsI (penicillin-binding protein 3)